MSARTRAIITVSLLVFAISSLPTVAYASGVDLVSSNTLINQTIDSSQDSRKWGSCPWEIDSTGTLIIHPGEGVQIVPANGEEFPWMESANSINSVVFASEGEKRVVAPYDIAFMLRYLPNLKSVDFSGFDTSEVTNMSYMFQGCPLLQSVDMSMLNTSKATGFSCMFEGCTSLQSANLSGIDTSKMVSMGSMFEGCSSLESLNLAGWDTSSVKYMGWMFKGCSSLTTLDLSRFDFSSMESMEVMFDGCSSLRTLKLPSQGAPNVTNMVCTFRDCASLESLDLSGFLTPNLQNMHEAFSGCSSLSSLDLSPLNASKVEYMDSMLAGCTSLKSFEATNLGTLSVKSMGYMFSGCSSLESVDVSHLDTSSVTYVGYMFSGCSSLTILDLSSFDTTKVKDADPLFAGCTSLAKVKVGSFFTRELPSIDVNGHVDWWSEGASTWFTATQIAFNRRGVADVYTKEGRAKVELLNISAAEITVSDSVYTGAAIESEPVVKLSSVTLSKGADYSVSFKDNVNAGIATITITGKGRYSGSKDVSFKINAASLVGASISGLSDKAYNGKEQMPLPIVILSGKMLSNGTDYSVSYKDNVSAGKATLIITGRGNYTGETSATFNIVAVDAQPITSSDTTKPVEVKTNITKASITGLKDRRYTGREVTQDPSVKLNGKTLKAGADYTLSYKGNVNTGTATVIVTGKGNYAGSKSITFKIVKAMQSIKVNNKCSATVKAKKSGKTKALAKNVTVNLKSKAKVSAKTAVKYKKANKAGGKLIAVNKKTGKVTLKKGLKKGIYKVKVKLTAKASKNYKAAKDKTITLTVRVK